LKKSVLLAITALSLYGARPLVTDDARGYNGRTVLAGGGRLWLIPDKVQVDMTYGSGGKVSQEWITFGMRILGSRWFD
jgi:hypothetical protein